MARASTYYVKNLAQKGAEATAIAVEALGAGRYAVTMNGVRREVESLLLPQGGQSLLIDGTSYGVELEHKPQTLNVTLRGQTSRFDVCDEHALRLRAASGAFSTEGKQTVVAPMPGKIVKVFVKVGDEVKEGQGLVVVEAMKMENELKSPKAGKVTEVLAKEGTTVDNGAKLVVVE